MRKILTLPGLVIMVLVTHTCCKTTIDASSDRAARIVAEDFDRFYQRFHTDSVFQISRIRYPLGGYHADGFEETKWVKGSTPLMRTMIYDVDTTVYKVSYKKSDAEFIQKVWLENSGFSSESRFKLIKNRWYLVYVLDLNL